MCCAPFIIAMGDLCKYMNSTDTVGVVLVRGSAARGSFNKVQKITRFLSKHILRQVLKPQAGLGPCTECTAEVTSYGR
jgi:hypothetical protein